MSIKLDVDVEKHWYNAKYVVAQLLANTGLD